MNTITDITYYQSSVVKFIPNLNNINTEIPGVPNSGSKLDAIIELYERDLLFSFLNVSLFNELQTALIDIDNADQKWQSLVKGVEYTKDNKTYRFDGLRGFENDSLVAYFVFCKYMINDESDYTTTGISQYKGENRFNPTRKYKISWNRFIKKYQDVQYDYNENILYDYSGNILGIDYYQNSNDTIVTLETFLMDHKDDYDGYNFKRFDLGNTLGI